jgi:threonine/homoserine/homoserine lactone efflux protein
MTSALWAFLGISILVIVTPGPDTALTIRNTLLGGRGGGVFTALGVAAGQSIWALATSIGIVGLLVASAPVFTAVKLAGAAYLVYLGAVALRDACRASGAVTMGGAAPARHRLAAASAFRQGLVSDLGNPKMAIFFTSLLPQFAPAGDSAFAALILLGLVFCAMTFLWLAGYAMALARVGAYLRRPWLRRALAGATGAVLIALGLRLAAEQR